MFMILLTSTNNKINDFIDTPSSLNHVFRLLFATIRATFNDYRFSGCLNPARP